MTPKDGRYLVQDNQLVHRVDNLVLLALLTLPPATTPSKDLRIWMGKVIHPWFSTPTRTWNILVGSPVLEVNAGKSHIIGKTAQQGARQKPVKMLTTAWGFILIKKTLD